VVEWALFRIFALWWSSLTETEAGHLQATVSIIDVFLNFIVSGWASVGEAWWWTRNWSTVAFAFFVTLADFAFTQW
jgi:hypothetical protein